MATNQDELSVSSSDSCAQAEEAEAEHTPGPWRLRNGHIESVAETGDVHIGIVASVGCKRPDHIAEAKANAELIAAAPDLLRAAKMALDEVEYYSHGTVKALADAIAKAEGEA